MRYGFTGTRAVEGYESDITTWLDSVVVNGTEFTTGACVGFDALAARHLAAMYPDALHRLIVPSNRSQIDAQLLTEFDALNTSAVELMSSGTSYKSRNARILDHTDVLIGVAEYPERHGKSVRSGTWQTIRMGRALQCIDNKIRLKVLITELDR